MISEINNLAEIWWQWMASMLWQASLFILFISIIDVIIRKWAWPQVRYTLWLLVLLKLMIPPTWALPSSVYSNIQPAIEKTIFMESKITRVSSQNSILNTNPGEQLTVSVDEQKILSKSESQFTVQDSGKAELTWIVYVFTIWIMGVLIFLLLLVLKMIKLRKWHQEYKQNKTIPAWFHELIVQTNKRLGLNRLPAIVFSDGIGTPAVYGLFRPVMLFPVNYINQLPKEEAEYILLHELSHLRRGDLWMHSLCLFLQIIYWFNPLLIWVRRQMKHVREICCDLTVAAILKEKAKHYRQTLLNTARNLLTESVEPGLGLLGVFEEPFRLITRLQWLERKAWEKRFHAIATAFGLSIFMIACIMPMAEVKNDSISETTSIKQMKELNKAEESSSFLNTTNDFFNDFASGNKLSHGSRFNFRVKKESGFSAVVLPMRGSYEQLPEAMNRLQHYLESRNTEPSSPSFLRQMSDARIINPEFEHVWEVGYAVPGDTRVHEPFQIRKFPKRQVSYTKLTGTFDEDVLNMDWCVWFYDNNYKVTDAALVFCPDRLYKHWHPRPEWELQVGIEKMDKPYPEVDIYTKWSEQILAIVLPMLGSWEQKDLALEKLKDYLDENNIVPVGDPFFRFFNSSTKVPEEELLWEVGYPVSKEVSAKSPFEIRSITDDLVAYTIVECTEEELERYSLAFALLTMREGFLGIGYPIIFTRDKNAQGIVKREIRVPVRRKRQNPNKLPIF